MSHSTISKRVPSKRVFLSLAMLSGAVMVSTAAAQSLPQSAPPASYADQPAATSKTPESDHRLVKPGDRNCLRQTGSLIPPKKGDCLPVAGRSYSHDELRNTGAIDNAHALQMLDPSISLGH